MLTGWACEAKYPGLTLADPAYMTAFSNYPIEPHPEKSSLVLSKTKSAKCTMGKQFEQTKLMQLDDKFLIEDQVLKE